MGVPLDRFMDRFSAEERQAIDARAEALIAEEMSLRDLRKAMGKTQVAIAEKLHMKQENVSRVEQRADMLLSTLDGYLRAMGGRLRLVVEFKDRAPVRLSGLTNIDSVVARRITKNVAANFTVAKGQKAYAARSKPRQTSARGRGTTPAR